MEEFRPKENFLLQQNVITQIVKELQARSKTFISIEGPPVQAYPDWEDSYMGWDKSAFCKGWLLAEQLYNSIDALETAALPLTAQTYVLLDDYNYSKEKFTQDSSLTFIKETFSIIGDFSFYNKVFLNTENVTVESSLGAEKKREERHAEFQLQKFITATEKSKLAMMTHIVIHPITYKTQQLDMFVHLNKLIGIQTENKILKNISRLYRRKLFSSYIHIWMNEQGNIADLTNPIWSVEEQRFKHQAYIPQSLSRWKK